MFLSLYFIKCFKQQNFIFFIIIVDSYNYLMHNIVDRINKGDENMNLLTIARYNGIFNRQTQAYIAAAFSSMNISYSEGILLMNLYDNEGNNQEELSSMLYIDKAATARSIKSLEKKGYITREVKSKDRRVKKLYLTDYAISQKEYFSSLIQKWDDFITEGVDTETLNHFSEVLQVMAQKSAIADFDKLFKLKGCDKML